MSLFGFLKPRQSPESIYDLCLREQPSSEWDEADDTITFGVIREIAFDIENSMAQAKLLVPRGDQCVELLSHSYVKPVKMFGGWRVNAEPSIGMMGRNKLVGGTIPLEAGDVVQISMVKDSTLLTEPDFPRTPDGWTANMFAKFLPHQGYRMGQVYYFKGPWNP
jgi:hypothetical protein